jgi:hypothetical protein
MQQILGCKIESFPIRYLGLPLSTKKVPRHQIQKTVDAVARRLPPTHSPLMAKRGRLIWVKAVLSAILVYAMIVDGYLHGPERRSMQSVAGFSGLAKTAT